jgi:hypothetical protein
MWTDFDDRTLANLAGQTWTPSKIEPSPDDERVTDWMDPRCDDPEVYGYLD